MLSKARIFITDAGKVIMVISLVLWALSSFGPGTRMATVDQHFQTAMQANAGNAATLEREHASARLENSYAGLLGKAIEPVLTPLGFDWKIGIAIITSFAAREVFVGTMATLYSVGDDGEGLMLRDKMRAAKKRDGTPVYTLATGVSLMIFYVFAMQCMSTLAVTKRETKTWKWPLIQLLYMTALAYFSSLLVYQLF
jgi:ferrous iron transport protein B